jgi:catechol 2,3-dioxygenase-like lactoylglutathione lyase family enzyme
MSDSPVQITGIHHVGIPVSDFDRALAFYVGVLGLEPIAAPKAFAANVRWLRLGNEHIHLIKSNLKPEPDSPRHVALHIKDVRAAQKHLEGLGFKLTPQPFVTNAERFYINDPDGNSVELIQWFQDWGDGSRQ